MDRSSAAILIAACLLMQTLLGSISSGVVICVQRAPHDNMSVCCPAVRACCCCEAESAVTVKKTLRLTQPCPDDCEGCLDVELPDDRMRAEHVAVNWFGPLAAEAQPSFAPGWGNAVNASHIIPHGTGPPERRAGPDAPHIRSTRLLI